MRNNTLYMYYRLGQLDGADQHCRNSVLSDVVLCTYMLQILFYTCFFCVLRKQNSCDFYEVWLLRGLWATAMKPAFITSDALGKEI